VEAEEALMIGDTEYDLQMARNAGVRSVAAGYGAHEPERLAGHGPLTILEDIADLIDWLDGEERPYRVPTAG
jgi:phosphoglycolate phosphatase